MSLAGLAKETMRIVEEGRYRSPAGAEVSIEDAVRRAVQGTVLYRPEDFAGLLAGALPAADAASTSSVRIEVTSESTAEAARRLFEAEGERHIAALNFASAKNPGGGFLGGAKAQEEDLARCSALYSCQIKKRAYYDANRACGTLLYTDHQIYSPDVPFFRDERLELLETPFLVSIITSPAPNAGEELRNHPGAGAEILKALRRRAEQILRVALHHRHEVLVLGAWGCGVFRNDPHQVAQVFAELLSQPPFRSSFRRAVFGIYDRSKGQTTLRAFQERLGPR